MSLLIDIRRNYMPVQPTIKQRSDNVTYRELVPDKVLEPLIYCYWQLKTTELLAEPFNYRVVADGCIDIFFELDKPEESFVMGFCKKYTEFRLDNTFNYIGVRFLPTVFPQLFRINALEISNRVEHLGMILPETSRFIKENLAADFTLHDIAQVLDKYFIHHLSNIKLNQDSRLYESIDLILQTAGMINVDKDLNTGISARQLRRLFQYYIGDTPKTFSKVVRFQNILRAKPSVQSLRKNKLFFDAGYYDQAHFIKEFRNFYGVTPTRAFGR